MTQAIMGWVGADVTLRLFNNSLKKSSCCEHTLVYFLFPNTDRIQVVGKAIVSSCLRLVFVSGCQSVVNPTRNIIVYPQDKVLIAYCIL